MPTNVDNMRIEKHPDYYFIQYFEFWIPIATGMEQQQNRKKRVLNNTFFGIALIAVTLTNWFQLVAMFHSKYEFQFYYY